jgi:hypothetical protein
LFGHGFFLLPNQLPIASCAQVSDRFAGRLGPASRIPKTDRGRKVGHVEHQYLRSTAKHGAKSFSVGIGPETEARTAAKRCALARIGPKLTEEQMLLR